MPSTFLYIATYFFLLLLLLKAFLNSKNCMSKDSCHWHKPAYWLFSLWPGETTKVFFSVVRHDNLSEASKTDSHCHCVFTLMLPHLDILLFSSFFFNLRSLLLSSLFSASFVAIYRVGKLVCSLETYFVNPGKTSFVYLRKQLGPHCFSHQSTVRFSIHI